MAVASLGGQQRWIAPRSWRPWLQETRSRLQCLWTCVPGWEEALIAELAASTTSSHVAIAPGWLQAERVSRSIGSSQICMALATQCLPDATELFAPSISAWARQCGEWLIERLRDHHGPWRFHRFSHYPPGDVSGRRRCELIEAALHEFLRPQAAAIAAQLARRSGGALAGGRSARPAWSP